MIKRKHSAFKQRVLFRGLLFLVAFVLSFGAYAQWDTTWTRTYGGNRDDKALDMIATSDGGFLLIGSTSSFGLSDAQMYFLKLDSLGLIQWSRNYGGSGQESGTSVIQTSDKGYLAVGYTNSFGAGGYDYFLVKLDSTGSFEYQEVFGGSDWDFANDVIEYAPGEYIIGGETYSYGNGNSDGLVVKFEESSQQFVWNITVGDTARDFINALTKSPNGEIVAVGGITPQDSAYTDVLLTGIASDGSQINWIKNYGGSLEDYANDVITMSDSSYVFTGKREFVDSTKVYTIRIDRYLNIIWEEIWNKGNYGEGTSLLERPDGNPAVFGFTNKQGTKIDNFYVFMGFNGSGEHGLFGDDYGYAMIRTNSDMYLMAGYTDDFNSSYTKILIFKTLDGIVDESNFEFIEDQNSITSIQNSESRSKLILIYNDRHQTIKIAGILQKDYSNFAVYSITGQLVKSGTINISNHEVKINSGRLRSGLYLITIFGSHSRNSQILYVR